MSYVEIIKSCLEDSIKTNKLILNDEDLCIKIEIVSQILVNSLKGGGKLILCGNGGSASGAIHIAAEFIGRFNEDRDAIYAMALNTNIATITAIANDYGYDYLYSRQINGIMKKEDVLVSISTSGMSRNIINAIEAAKNKGCKTVSLLGKNGGEAREISDISIVIPSQSTARIQESHISIGHILCELVEAKLQNCLYIDKSRV